jgi:muconate cycloisomerase
MRDAIILAIDTTILDVPLRRPHRFSTLTIDSQSLLLVRVETRDGVVGIGEGVVPGGPWWGGESIEGMKTMVDLYLAPHLVGESLHEVTRLSRKMDRTVAGAEFAKAGVEMAMWDACGKGYGLPCTSFWEGHTAIGCRSPGRWVPNRQMPLFPRRGRSSTPARISHSN